MGCPMPSMKDILGDVPYQPQLPNVPAPVSDKIPEEVYAKFEMLALQVFAQGRVRYSADAILHRVRWHFSIDERRDDFKCNNNWTAPLARWFLKKHPEVGDFFELRVRKSQEKHGHE